MWPGEEGEGKKGRGGRGGEEGEGRKGGEEGEGRKGRGGRGGEEGLPHPVPPSVVPHLEQLAQRPLHGGTTAGLGCKLKHLEGTCAGYHLT